MKNINSTYEITICSNSGSVTIDAGNNLAKAKPLLRKSLREHAFCGDTSSVTHLRIAGREDVIAGYMQTSQGRVYPITV